MMQDDSTRMMEEEELEEPAEARGMSTRALLVSMYSGLARLPLANDKELYRDTREVAELLGVTVQRINQYCADEGLPKHSRNKFYFPDVLNWQKVKSIADRFHTNPMELARFGFVDFTLKQYDGGAPFGGRNAPTIDKHLSLSILRSVNKQAASHKNKRVFTQPINPSTKKKRDK